MDPDDGAVLEVGAALPVYSIRTTNEHRSVAGGDSCIASVPDGIYVQLGDGPPAVNVAVLGRLLRKVSEKLSTNLGEILHHAEWVITDDPAIVEERGMHGRPDCTTCRTGVDKALAHLAEGGDPLLGRHALLGRTVRRWLGERLRRLADRLDYGGAPRAIGWSFTFERGEGIRFRDDGKGCRLWYLSEADYDKAHTEADKLPVRIPWGDLADSAKQVRLGGDEGNGTWEPRKVR